MYISEAIEIEILKHLYEIGLLNINGGWEKKQNRIKMQSMDCIVLNM